MHSMTGYGAIQIEEEGRIFHLELKCVNHRYLDITFRMPRSMSFLEEDLRAALKGRLTRGHVDVYVYYRNMREDARTVTVNAALFGQYSRALSQLTGEYGVPNDMAASHALRMPEVLVVTESPEDQDALRTLALSAAQQALDSVIAMRSAEGSHLRTDILEKIEIIRGIAAQIAERSPSVAAEYREKLENRISEMMGGRIDEQRLAMEAAFFADKSSIDEEIVRLESHFAQIRTALGSQEPSGRRMDFIVQEMNREINTIGSKASDAQIGALVVSAKSEIEKIREQVQNIE